MHRSRPPTRSPPSNPSPRSSAGATTARTARAGAPEDHAEDDADGVEPTVVQTPPPIAFLDEPLPDPTPAANPADSRVAAGEPTTDEHLFGVPAARTEPTASPEGKVPPSIAFDDDELERKLAASENDHMLHGRDRAARFDAPARTPPPSPAVDAPAPAAVPDPPAPTPPPTPTPVPTPPPEPAKPAADVADDPLAAELEKLFSKLSRGPEGNH